MKPLKSDAEGGFELPPSRSGRPVGARPPTRRRSSRDGERADRLHVGLGDPIRIAGGRSTRQVRVLGDRLRRASFDLGFGGRGPAWLDADGYGHRLDLFDRAGRAPRRAGRGRRPEGRRSEDRAENGPRHGVEVSSRRHRGEDPGRRARPPPDLEKRLGGSPAPPEHRLNDRLQIARNVGRPGVRTKRPAGRPEPLQRHASPSRRATLDDVQVSGPNVILALLQVGGVGFIVRPDDSNVQSRLRQRRVASSGWPVSRRLLRLARIAGQPFETISINLEPGLSISWIRVSFTMSPCGSSS